MKLFHKSLSASLLVVALFFAGCTADGLVGAEGDDLAVRSETSQENACWGQASKVFAKAGEMGIHASAEPTPRIGLYNLAVLLFDLGMIEEASLPALGVFVSSDLDETIEACL